MSEKSTGNWFGIDEPVSRLITILILCERNPSHVAVNSLSNLFYAEYRVAAAFSRRLRASACCAVSDAAAFSNV